MDATPPEPSDTRLVALTVADDPVAWADAGFHVDGDRVRLGTVDVVLAGHPEEGAPRGITEWTLRGVEAVGGYLDGLRTAVAAPTDAEPEPVHHAHPNGCTGLDHVVVLTPDLDRTLEAFAAAGLDLRRIRDTTSAGAPMRQAFFRLGPTIVEVVGGDTGNGLPAEDAPSVWFGIAVDVDDLDATSSLLGDSLGAIKGAVQPGRRIATVRHKQLGLSVAIAAMDHHGDR